MLPIVDCSALGQSESADLRLGQEIDVIFRRADQLNCTAKKLTFCR